jgi:hypothetical protein
MAADISSVVGLKRVFVSIISANPPHSPVVPTVRDLTETGFVFSQSLAPPLASSVARGRQLDLSELWSYHLSVNAV